MSIVKLVSIFAVSQSLTPTAMLEYLLYAIIIALAALAGYRRSVREEHDGTAERRRRRKERRRRYKQIENEAFWKYPAAGHYYKRIAYIKQRLRQEGL